ncbi:MAG TPA: hypothetical protein VHY20_06715 [Pirellulales bacterium]|nr:hypothetical protein [Pirellulales bacterium]
MNALVQRVFSLAAGGILLLSAAAQAADEAKTDRSPPKQKIVYVGTYLNQLNGMSLKDQKVSLDFHIWFRWKDDDLKPLETFDLTNGQIDAKEDTYEKKIGDTHYAVCRCMATIQKQWDVHDFPLDNHDITIEVEDNDDEEFKLRYVADVENCNLNPDARVAGWQLADGGADVVTHLSNTNFGDVSLPTGHSSSWSRYIYTVHLQRTGFGYFMKLFTGLFVAAAIAMISLLTQATELDSRFGLGVGAIFAAVASEYVVSGALPDSNLLSLSDRLHIITFLFIFLALVESTASHKLQNLNRPESAWWLDRISFFVFTASYVTIVVSMVLAVKA